jgi:hypothetical protein
MRAVFQRCSPRMLVLLAVNLTVAAGIVHELWGGTATRELLGTAPRSGLTLPGLPLESPHTTALNTIQEHALFHATRTFFVAVDPHALPIPKPDYELVGTLIIPRKPTVALLRQRATSASRKVKPGDDLDGWMVEVVENGRVVITNKDKRAEIARAGAQNAKGADGLRIAPLQRTAAPLQRAATPLQRVAAPSPVVSRSDDRPQVYRPPP